MSARRRAARAPPRAAPAARVWRARLRGVGARRGSAGPASRSACSRSTSRCRRCSSATSSRRRARRSSASCSASSRSGAASGASAGARSSRASPALAGRLRRRSRAPATSSASSSGARSLAAMLRYATPLTFAALGGVVSERAGRRQHRPRGHDAHGRVLRRLGRRRHRRRWVGGLVIGMAAGGVLALIHAVFAISLRADQIVSGTAVNLLALGITGFLYIDIYGEQGTPDDLPEIPDVHAADRLDPVLRRRAGDAQPDGLARAGARRRADRVPVPHRRRACGCGPWARTRSPPTRRASRRSACATAR